MTEIATAYISVVPEVNKAIQAAYADAAKGGQRLGEALGSGISSGAGAGLDTLKAKAQATSGAVQKAARDMAAAQKTEADAAGVLRVAVLKLNEARESGTTKTSALVAAEERVAKAQRTSEATSKGARDAIERHESAVRRAEAATRSFADAQDGASKKTKTIGDSYQRTSRDIGDATTKVGGFADKVKGYVGVMAGVAAGAALGGMFKDMISEARESQKVTAVTAQIIKSTGGTAKISADQIGALANAISNKTGIDDEAIQSGSNLLLTFKNVANQVGDGANIFDRATAAAADLSKAGFGDLDSAAKMLGKALNDPVAGMTALSKAGVTFSAQQKEQIKAMVASGDVLGAQKLIMAEVESQVGGVAAASATAGEKAATTWKNFQEELGNKLLPVLDKVAAWFTETAIPALSKMSGAFDWVGENLSTLLLLGGALATIGTALAIGSALMPIWAAGAAIAAGETTLWAVAQNLLNAAFLANPIGLILIGVIALVAAVIYAWNNFETFRNVVTAVWEGIQSAVGAVVDWFKAYVLPVLQRVFEGISFVVSLWWNYYIKPIFAAVSAVVRAFVWVIQNGLQTAQDAFQTVLNFFSSTWDTITSGVGAVQDAFASVWASVESIVGGVIDWFSTYVAPVFDRVFGAIMWVLKIFQAVFRIAWEVVYQATSIIVEWFQVTVLPILLAVFDGIKAGVQAVAGFFVDRWHEIQSVVGAVAAWFYDTFAPILQTVWDIIRAVFQVFVDFFQAAWRGIQQVVQAVIDWFNTYVVPILQTVWNTIRAAFQALTDFFAEKWNAIRDAARAVSDWFTGTLVPAFQRAWDSIKSSFQTTVDVIGGIFNKLKELAKAPIDFIVRTVINAGLIDGINTVAGWLKISDSVHLDHVPWPPAGWAGGGWTGPGGTYDPAGVVHADEFVVKKKSRRSIEGAVPGFLDALNVYGARALGYAKGGRVRPVPGAGKRDSSGGLDFPVPLGTPVHAAEAGMVSVVNMWERSYGHHVREVLESGGQAIYAHLTSIGVSVGQQLAAGDVIGTSGSTGNSTGPHLHFEIVPSTDEAAWLAGAADAPGGSGGILNFLKEKVVNFFRDNINTLLDKIPGEGGLFRDVGVAGAKKLIDSVADFLIGKAEATDSASGAVPNGTNQQIAQAMLGLYGWGPDQMGALIQLWQGESGWNENAHNPSSGAHGIPQSLPASKMASAGPDYMTNPATQIKWGLQYIKDVYGSPSNALAKWGSRSPHWYAEGGLVEPLLLDAGGIIPRGVSFVENRTGAPETLLRPGGSGMPSTVVLQVGDREFTGYLREEIGRPAQMAAAGRRTV